jgi:hypothetical protein
MCFNMANCNSRYDVWNTADAPRSRPTMVLDGFWPMELASIMKYRYIVLFAA